MLEEVGIEASSSASKILILLILFFLSPHLFMLLSLRCTASSGREESRGSPIF